MKTLAAKRIPIAWFLLALIALAAAGILWLLATRAATPANAVLISSAPTIAPGGQAGMPGATSQPGMVAPTSAALPTPQALVVYVSGEVASPGVYTLPLGSRLADAVAASGGFTENANREGINLAARVTDEQHISVPRLGEPVQATQGEAKGQGGAPDASVTGGEASPSPESTVSGAPPPKVNINTANAQALEELPGIGEVLAARIVADRQANGPFKTVDDLARVPGIKEHVISQLRDLVTVGP
ncbi:MAG TPA: ComEA family DNA-binding protein [Chloroflexia bacterium]